MFHDALSPFATTPPRTGPGSGIHAGIAGLVPAGIELASLPAWTGLQTAAIATVAAVAAAVAGWWSWRLLAGEDEQTETPELPEPPVSVESGESPAPDRAGPTRPDSGLERLSELSAGAEIEDAVLTPDHEMPVRHCPECDRRFPGVFDVCPFDSATLQQDKYGDEESPERLPRQYCPDCGRRYELGASHCYYDGASLLRDTRRAAAGAESFSVCRECGFEARDTSRESCPDCPDGEGALALLDPGRTGEQSKPVFPYNRCRQCGHIAAPDETRCPNDGTLLLPELDASLTALPPTGHGTRRCVCPECGISFAGQCNYCSRDGTELLPLN